jgi:hypothetical protein
VKNEGQISRRQAFTLVTMTREIDHETVRLRLSGLIGKYLRDTAAKRQLAVAEIDTVIATAVGRGIGAEEIAALVVGSINKSTKARSTQAEELRRRYLRRNSKFWTTLFGVQ